MFPKITPTEFPHPKKASNPKLLHHPVIPPSRKPTLKTKTVKTRLTGQEEASLQIPNIKIERILLNLINLLLFT